jgi:hypothetical protein
LSGIDQHQDRIVCGPLFDLQHSINGVRIKRIGAQPVQAARRKRYHPTLLNNGSRLLYDFRLRIFGIYFLYS